MKHESMVVDFGMTASYISRRDSGPGQPPRLRAAKGSQGTIRGDFVERTPHSLNTRHAFNLWTRETNDCHRGVLINELTASKRPDFMPISCPGTGSSAPSF